MPLYHWFDSFTSAIYFGELFYKFIKKLYCWAVYVGLYYLVKADLSSYKSPPYLILNNNKL